MRRFLATMVLLAGLAVLIPQAGTARADPVAEAAIRGIITSQLDAFRRDDWAEAFSYASPFLQKMFGTPDSFRSMVLGGYRVVHRPREVDFRDLNLDGPKPVQTVFFIGPDGKAYLAAYEMELQEDGAWRIAGVQLMRAPGAAV